MMEETAVDLMRTPNIVAIVHAWIPMEATEEILQQLQRQLQQAQLGQQELGVQQLQHIQQQLMTQVIMD